MEFLLYCLSDTAVNFMYNKRSSTLCIKISKLCTTLTAASSQISEDSPCMSNQKSHTMPKRERFCFVELTSNNLRHMTFLQAQKML